MHYNYKKKKKNYEIDFDPPTWSKIDYDPSDGLVWSNESVWMDIWSNLLIPLFDNTGQLYSQHSSVNLKMGL